MDLIDEYLALFRIIADTPHKEKLVAGVSKEENGEGDCGAQERVREEGLEGSVHRAR